jgi:hypothetical protein
LSTVLYISIVTRIESLVCLGVHYRLRSMSTRKE